MRLVEFSSYRRQVHMSVTKFKIFHSRSLLLRCKFFFKAESFISYFMAFLSKINLKIFLVGWHHKFASNQHISRVPAVFQEILQKKILTIPLEIETTPRIQLSFVLHKSWIEFQSLKCMHKFHLTTDLSGITLLKMWKGVQLNSLKTQFSWMDTFENYFRAVWGVIKKRSIGMYIFRAFSLQQKIWWNFKPDMSPF